MAKPVKNVPKDIPVEDYLTTLTDEQTIEDSHVLIEMMKRVTGHEPKIWNVGTVGFDSYHYKYASGREGDAQSVSFYPRDGKITIYLMDGTARHAEKLAKLGKHTTSRVCLYIKRLSDLDLNVLEDVVRESYKYVQSLDGQMHHVET